MSLDFIDGIDLKGAKGVRGSFGNDLGLLIEYAKKRVALVTFATKEERDVAMLKLARKIQMIRRLKQRGCA